MTNKEAAQYIKDVFVKALETVHAEFGEGRLYLDDIGSRTFYQLFSQDESPAYDLISGLFDYKTRQRFSNLVDVYLQEKHNFKSMECEGGGEGSGEYCYGVIRLDDKYFKAEWSYYSYNGCEYDGIEATIHEVKPVQKYVTVFEKV